MYKLCTIANWFELIIMTVHRVACHNFGHPAQTSLFTKGKNNFATYVNDLSVLKLFQLSNGDIFFCVACLQCSIYKVRKPIMTTLG